MRYQPLSRRLINLIYPLVIYMAIGMAVLGLYPNGGLMANLIEKNIIGYAGRESHEPIRKLLNKSSNEKVNRYKCNKVIEEAKKYNDAVKALEKDRRLGKVKDDLYFQLKRKLMLIKKQLCH